MPKKFTIATYDKKHKENLAKRAKKVQQLYDAAVKRIAQAAAPSLFDADNQEKEFHFEDFPALKKEMEELMQDLGASLQTNIEDGDQESWTLSNTKNDAMVDSIIGTKQLPAKTVKAWKHPHLEALGAFISRKEEGMNLSKRVWNLTQQFKNEMELALELGMGEGKSAAELSRDIRKYLQYPDKLFRRVRDKSGALRLSKAAAAFHPGRGVYRSSYKNALRMTATENNIAYRTADHNRWQALPFVLGIEIHISNNHPTDDICDIFDGKRFPKDFKFTGWHPWCRCYAVSVLASQEEMDAYTTALMNGEDVSHWKFSGQVEKMPKEFTKWMKDNQQRIANATSMPYFIKDNYKDGDPTKGLRWEGKKPDQAKKPAKPTKSKHEIIMENAAKRHAARTSEQIDDIKDAWRDRRLDAYDDRCDQLMKTLTYSQGQTLPALAKRQIALRNAIGKNASVKEVEALFAKFEKGVKAQNEWDTQVWGSFTKEQIANMRDIEKSLGIKKGRPMTYEEADRQSANPLHVNEYIVDKKSRFVLRGTNIHVSKNPLYDKAKHKPYGINCQTCAPAYALREWGFNVYAKGNTEKWGDLSYYLSKGDNWLETWTNKDGSPVSITSFKDYLKAHPSWKHMTQQRYLQYFDEVCKEEGTYEIGLAWESGGGHCTIVKRFSDGSIKYIEPQTDNSNGSGFEEKDIKYLCEMMKKDPILKDGAIKVSDKLLNIKYVSIFLK
ncbi:toxin glutamine deamidase domain-containing protein [Prevotella sp. 885]|uniref:toxin glutamine deamidase domain-containing protein n=1 Tax=Prevotella sp. 885 TaxID=2022527 RepID=UPI000B9FC443|nr:toxin glutamine deamidase domain-containing protein [Prevotella sp. 885]OZT04974.1 hypothetical protein CHL74_01940 [Prevotella sp. 885]